MAASKLLLKSKPFMAIQSRYLVATVATHSSGDCAVQEVDNRVTAVLTTRIAQDAAGLQRSQIQSNAVGNE